MSKVSATKKFKSKLFLSIGLFAFVTVLLSVDNQMLSKNARYIEITSSAQSPSGYTGGSALPASCESGVWNNNNTYHLDGVTSDPGNCATPVNPTPENGICGGADGVETNTSPSGNLCTKGTASAISGNGPWTWICSGTNGGSDASCRAPKTNPVNNPPNTPTISGDQWAKVNMSTSNWIVATDPENDDIYYELDWDCDGSIDGTTGSQASGFNTPIGHTYTSIGTYKVCGYAVQTNDTSKRSGKGIYTIRVTDGECTAPANACGATSGTISNGSCVAPGLPVGYGNNCSGSANACGMTNNNGTINCDGQCVGATTPSNTLCGCTSSANACGMTSSGNLNAAGACTATTPSDSLCPEPGANNPPETPVISGDQWAVVNQSTSNWIRSTDPENDDIFYELDWDCNGSIDGTTSSQASGFNTPIGHTYTSVGTKTVCGYAVQANDTSKRSGEGRYTIRVTNGNCTVPANACGATNGSVVNGQCVAPGLPAGYGNNCSGSANACGMTNNNGTINCDGQCVGATTPSNTLCGVVIDPFVNNPPETPVISGDQWAVVNQSTSNWIRSTDPENDDIFYELDWDCNGSIDGTTSSQASGFNTPIGHTYTSVGTKTVCGYAVQANDTSKRSGEGRYTIRVTNGNCTVPANACGATNGSVVNGQCVAPGLPAGYGNNCSGSANACGMTNNNGTINCDGQCVGATTPSNTLCGCTSSANACGMTSSGNLNAAGACTATTPSDSLCPEPGAGVTINSFTASPKLIAQGKTSRLYWDITGNRNGCRITYTTNTSNNPVVVTNQVDANVGQLQTTAVTEKRYYKLSCGASEQTAIVSVFSLTEI